MICCVELKHCSIIFYPGRFTLHAPELSFAVLNNQIVSLFSSMRSKHYISKLEEASSDRGFTDAADMISVELALAYKFHVFFPFPRICNATIYRKVISNA